MRRFVLIGKWSVVRDTLKILAELEQTFPDLMGLCLDHAIKLE
jgi:hypothetical protein